MRFADSLLMSWSTLFKQTLFDFCDIETSDDPYTLVTRNGSLMSVIAFNGITFIPGDQEMRNLMQQVIDCLKPYLEGNGHTFEISFTRDSDAVGRDLSEALTPAMQTADRLRLGVTDILDERIENLSHYCASEQVLITLWSHAGIMPAAEVKRATKERAATMGQFPGNGVENQNPFSAIRQLRDRHRSLVNSLVSDLGRLGVLSVVEVHEALRLIRMHIDPEFTNSQWRPSLPGDRAPAVAGPQHNARARTISDGDGGIPPDPEVADLLWPSIGWQIFPRDVERTGASMVQIGTRAYAPLFLNVPPQDPGIFSHLFSRVDLGIPWRISFLITGNGLASTGLKSTMAKILSIGSSTNQGIGRALEELSALSREGESIIRLQTSFVTWAPASDQNTLESRKALLARAVEGWGTCDVREEAGDPTAGWLSTVPALNTRSVAPAAIAPLTDVAYMLPLARPASHWEAGAVLFRTPDGKLWPYQPGSSKQTNWVDLIFAPPGHGKSVLMNIINFALCLSPGLTRLPRLVVIDIGPSSGGLINLVRDALPENLRYLVLSHKMQMSKDHAVNPLDTQLGARNPTPSERAFLVNLLSLLVTPAERDAPYANTSNLIGLVIDETYKQLADGQKPHPYHRGTEELIDRALDDRGIQVDAESTWWEIVDALFAASAFREATIAQRYAVPTLQDVMSSCAHAPAVQQMYGEHSNVRVETGELLSDAVSRMLSSALREYPILGLPTRLDLSSARIVALNLEDVAPSGSRAADRQTAIMYMLGRQMLARDFFLDEDVVQFVPDQYRNFHLQRVRDLKEDTKRLCYDEFHRTGGAQAVRDQVNRDIREVRKRNLQIALTSQMLQDFDEAMIGNSTSVFIMGAPDSMDEIRTTFNLTDTDEYVLRRYVHGPGPGGATFLMKYRVKQGGGFTQLLTATVGALERWAYSTTTEDALLRDTLAGIIGSAEARHVLATRFPDGTAKPEIERRARQILNDYNVNGEEATEGVINDLVRELAQ